MADTETCAIAAVFDDYRAAERATHDLIAGGISRDAIDVKSNFMAGAAGHTGSVLAAEPSGGGIGGFFKRIFGSDVPEEEQGHYAEAVRRGGTVVCVRESGDQLNRAIDILNEHGAIDIDRRVQEFRATGYQRYDPSAPAYTAEQVAKERAQYRPAERNSIPVVEEELRVGKRATVRGGVRVFTRVVDQPVQQEVRLREEHITVERRPVDRPVSDADVKALHDDTIELTERAEEPVIEKRARVKEEVVIGKETTERTEQVRDTVRHTEVKVDRTGGTEGAADYQSDFRQHFGANYTAMGGNYESFEPAYMYGYRSASESRYKGKPWSDVEPELRTDYLRQNPDSKWDNVKGMIRYGWEKVTRKR